MSLVSVIIPLYKETPDAYEQIGFERCLKILRKHPICLVTYAGFNLDYYNSKLLEYNIEASYKTFDKEYFVSLKGYNQLLLSRKFYEQFKEYEYILIYQLDAYVFRDDLEYWCKQGFDYVGAPWINTNIFKWLFIKNAYPKYLQIFHRLTKGRFLYKVGNGGLSLRKTSSMLRNLAVFGAFAKNWKANEDIFICHFIAVFNFLFRIPGTKQAVKFAFDINPAEAYKMNNNQLPFGCHAFNRNDAPNYSGSFEFWKDKIVELNATERIDK